MFRVFNNVISMTRGDTVNFTLTIKDGEGNDYDYSDDTVLFTLKRSVNTTDIICQKEVHYGEDIVITHEDTAGIPYGDYWYDVQISNEAGAVATVIPPTKFRVKTEVTF